MSLVSPRDGERASRLKKPLAAWEPLRYLLAIVLVFAAPIVVSAVPAGAQFVVAVVFAAVATAFVVWMLAGIIRGPGNPDADGRLRNLDGLTLVRADAADAGSAATNPFVVQVDRGTGERFRSRPEADRIEMQTEEAVLVPRATRWLGREYRIGVERIDVNGRVSRLGFLPRASDRDLDGILTALRAKRTYLVVPVEVTFTGGAVTKATADLGNVRRAAQSLS